MESGWKEMRRSQMQFTVESGKKNERPRFDVQVIRAILCAGLLFTLVGVSPANAHHGYSAYDMTSIKSAKATITSFEMANPHSSITCDIQGENGEIEHWVIETGAPMRGMRAGGFTPDTLKPGDVVTIYYYAAKNGSHVGAFNKVELPDGRVLPKRPESDPNAPKQ
jgi:hypothetical protein